VVNSGDRVIITAYPKPLHDTQGMTAQASDGKNTLNISMVQWNNQPNFENWQGIVTAPDNYTGSSVTYTVTVTATSIGGETAIAKTTFSVNPIPLPPPGNLSGTLTIVAVRRSGATQPAGTAKYGDNLQTTLNVNQPPPPSGLLNAYVTSWRITKAWVDTPQGQINTPDSTDPTLILRGRANIHMTLNGHSATCTYGENWAGYPPPIPDNQVMETDNIDAPFAVLVYYMYEVPVPTGNGGVTYVWRSGSYTASGNASTDLDITGTEFYIYNEAIHDIGTPVWES
jgi:hypothetical protein